MIYVGQNAFQIVVNTGFNFTGVSSSQIWLRYTSPSLSTGAFIPSVVTSTAGILAYTCGSTDSFEMGVWAMWAYAIQSTGRVMIGDPFLVTVKAEGDY